MNIRTLRKTLPSQDSSTGRGFKTGLQAFIGALVVFGTGLFGVIKGVPGCSEAITGFLQENAVQYALLLGVPAGLVGFLYNFLFRKEVSNW